MVCMIILICNGPLCRHLKERLIHLSRVVVIGTAVTGEDSMMFEFKRNLAVKELRKFVYPHVVICLSPCISMRHHVRIWMSCVLSTSGIKTT